MRYLVIKVRWYVQIKYIYQRLSTKIFRHLIYTCITHYILAAKFGLTLIYIYVKISNYLWVFFLKKRKKKERKWSNDSENETRKKKVRKWEQKKWVEIETIRNGNKKQRTSRNTSKMKAKVGRIRKNISIIKTQYIWRDTETEREREWQRKNGEKEHNEKVREKLI